MLVDDSARKTRIKLVYDDETAECLEISKNLSIRVYPAAYPTKRDMLPASLRKGVTPGCL